MKSLTRTFSSTASARWIAGGSALVAAAFVLVPAFEAVAQEVGKAAAVNPAAQSRGASGARTIVIGQSIAHRERIQTTSAGSVQLLFIDKTSMTIGPNSDLAIDEYVFDPRTNTGKMAATLTKGVMRFVGGQVSHQGNAQITTPNAVVGIRGGVAIISTQNVFIGYGQGSVSSGSSSVTLGAGDFTRTSGGGAPPTPPSAPPPNFVQQQVAAFQSGAGQGGGARASGAQVNNARTAATGSPGGSIATSNAAATANSAQQSASQNQSSSTTSGVTQTVQTSTQSNVVNQISHDSPGGGNQSAQSLFGWTAGLIGSVGQYGPIGPLLVGLGVATVETGPNGPKRANFYLGATNLTSSTNPNYYGPQPPYSYGEYEYGPDTVVLSEQLDNGQNVSGNALLPSKEANGQPKTFINGQRVLENNGGFLEIKPGSSFSNAAAQSLGVQFCQCEYTKWGLWVGETKRNSASGSPINERAEMFWVAGRLPSSSEMPVTGSATYNGHAVANIQNGSQNYVAGGQFQNTVDFGARTGNVSVSGLDGANYNGQVIYDASSPVFAGALSGSQQRTMVLSGSFFRGPTSPVGEMGGSLAIIGNNYTGAGIFMGKMQ